MAYTLDPALPQADIHLIKRMIPHRYPFLMIDRVANIEVNRFAIGIKNVTVNEPCFTGHFPKRPVFPGVLMLEALAQACGMSAPRFIRGFKAATDVTTGVHRLNLRLRRCL